MPVLGTEWDMEAYCQKVLETWGLSPGEAKEEDDPEVMTSCKHVKTLEYRCLLEENCWEHECWRDIIMQLQYQSSVYIVWLWWKTDCSIILGWNGGLLYSTLHSLFCSLTSVKWLHSPLDFLESIFANRIISRGIWPARSPDLTALDYSLRGALKGKVYENKPNTINELQVFIVKNSINLKQPVLHNVFDNIKNVSILAN